MTEPTTTDPEGEETRGERIARYAIWVFFIGVIIAVFAWVAIGR